MTNGVVRVGVEAVYELAVYPYLGICVHQIKCQSIIAVADLRPQSPAILFIYTCRSGFVPDNIAGIILHCKIRRKIAGAKDRIALKDTDIYQYRQKQYRYYGAESIVIALKLNLFFISNTS